MSVENKQQTNKTKPMIIVDDIKAIVKEHRGLIYGLVFILLIDHFFLNGSLKDKVKDILHKLLGKAETAFNTPKTPEVPAKTV